MPPDLALLSTLTLSRTNFHGPKVVRAIEVRLYLTIFFLNLPADLEPGSSVGYGLAY